MASNTKSIQKSRDCSLVEALAWSMSFQFAQAIVLVLFLVLLMVAVYGTNWPEAGQRIELALALELDRSFLLIGVSMLGALLLLLPLVRLRLGKNYREVIGWRTPRHEEAIFALATVIPIAVLGDLVYEHSKGWWSSSLFRSFIDEGFQLPLSLIHASAQTVSYPVLIVSLALAPAMAEEIVFRGIIGRSLTKQFGVWFGSVVTVCLFAAAHTEPAHALATVPIAILLQFLYLKTKTIWIPVFVHFCNNLLAVTVSRFDHWFELEVSNELAVVFFCYLILLLVLFEYRLRQLRWS